MLCLLSRGIVLALEIPRKHDRGVSLEDDFSEINIIKPQSLLSMANGKCLSGVGF